jgi:flagellar basal body-associated protein FliL
MAEDNAPQNTKRDIKTSWLMMGCVIVILIVIGLAIVIFWMGAEGANPAGKALGPSP